MYKDFIIEKSIALREIKKYKESRNKALSMPENLVTMYLE